MVASLAATSRTGLALLLEPDAPSTDQIGRAHGWRSSRTGDRVRHHGDDDYGALVQHAIVRYYVHGVEREQIANEVGYSPRQVQSWLLGHTAGPYGAPVLRTLYELGISRGRGGRTSLQPRLREIIAAYETLLALAADRLDRTFDRSLIATIRLLLAGREPLDGAQG